MMTFIFKNQVGCSRPVQGREVGRTVPVSRGSAGTPRPTALTRIARWGGTGTVLLAALLLSGCSSLLPIQPAQVDATKYYTLSAPPAPAAVAAPAANAPKLMILRVEVPAYLQHRPFVTRLGPNEVKLIDDVRWAEPLDLGIAPIKNGLCFSASMTYDVHFNDPDRFILGVFAGICASDRTKR